MVGPPRRLLEFHATAAKRPIEAIGDTHVVFPPPAPLALRPSCTHDREGACLSDEKKTVALIQERARGCAEAARESGGCQLVGAHARLDTKLLVSQMATSENAKTSKMDRQKRARGHGH